MKKNFMFFVFMLCCMVFNSNIVKADGYSFSINTNYAWGRDLSLNSYMKRTGTTVSTVIWQTSNKPSHYMWFGVKDETDTLMGQGKYSYLSEGSFITNINSYMNNSNKSFYLIARREYFVDPTTQVTGLWLP